MCAESCRTVGTQAKPCIFPFTYAGAHYSECTTRDSDTGQPWCATQVRATDIAMHCHDTDTRDIVMTLCHQVDTEGWVVDHAWGDCDTGCPGSREFRDSFELFF